MAVIKSMSQAGENALVAEEGEVLRTYRCPAGVLTIGVGLTKASGVVDPKPGMTITREESRRLLRLALNRNYIPRVQKAGLARSQNVFDGSVMFDYNTGRIHNASWVGSFINGKRKVAERLFKLWNKAGGRTLAGLVKRRDREWRIIDEGVYPAHGASAPSVSRSDEAVRAYQSDLATLGYDVGPIDGIEGVQTRNAVRKFQKDNGLTIDGIVGPATRAAIKRAMDKKQAGKATSGAGATAGAGTGAVDVSTGTDGAVETLTWALGAGVAVAAIVFGAFLIWRYRGPLFAWLPEDVKDRFEDRGIVIGRRVKT